ncbi:MAG: Endolytic murein transglycosylase [Gammaproteobacteria bacterium]|nr:Endolytic murein transglycosylase [Gammaproteobacteria bacterium]
MKKFWRYSLGSAILGVLVLMLMGVGYVYWSSRQPVHSGSESFVINPGTGVKQVALSLVEENVLDEPYTFILWAYVNDNTTRIHAGEYLIPADMPLDELLALFVSGRVIQRAVTLIEGWTFKEFREALNDAEKLRGEIRGLTNARVMGRLGAAGHRPEGRFFPDTYHYTADMSDLDVLKRAHTAMETVLDQEWQSRNTSTILTNKKEALILASIVEKETGLADERRTIAAVFHNRLRKGMRLQTDPTVIYGLGDGFDGNLTRTHLESDTPYNTYTRAGLPPTPIAMPGRASIHAALNPASSQALYFVSRGDGSHVFSGTLAEHNRNVFKYQLNRGKRPASTQAAEGDG